MMAILASGLIVLGLVFLVQAMDGWIGARNLPIAGKLSEMASWRGDGYVIDSPGQLIRVEQREFQELVDRENIVYGRPGEQLHVGFRTRSVKLLLGTLVLFVIGGCWFFGALRSLRQPRVSEDSDENSCVSL